MCCVCIRCMINLSSVYKARIQTVQSNFWLFQFNSFKYKYTFILDYITVRYNSISIDKKKPS